MKKFKSFHYGIDPNDEKAIIRTAVEWANKWFEENPDVKNVQFRHSLDNSGRDVICIMYEKRGELVEMEEFYYDAFANVTQYRCPKCGYQKTLDGLVTPYDLTCPNCKKGADI